MLQYLTGRILYSLLVILGIITVVFLLFSVLPGDPARMMLGQRADKESVEAINKDLGRDKPMFQQYLKFLNDVSPLSFHDTKNETHFLFLDETKYENYIKLLSVSSKAVVLKAPYLRRSYQSQRNVSSILLEALPGTTVLAMVSMLIATILGIFLGVYAAVNKNTYADRISTVLSIFGMSLPSFVAAILVVWTFAYLLGDITGLPVTGSLYEIDEFEGRTIAWKNLILPAFTLGIRPLAIVMQLTRSSMLEVLSMDYIRTARAKGLHFYNILFKHALVNALNPVVTAISGWFASLMAGAVFVEIIFGWKGLGVVMLDALNKYDLPVVMGSVLLVSVIFVAVSIAVDFIYALIDPRVKVY